MPRGSGSQIFAPAEENNLEGRVVRYIPWTDIYSGFIDPELFLAPYINTQKVAQELDEIINIHHAITNDRSLIISNIGITEKFTHLEGASTYRTILEKTLQSGNEPYDLHLDGLVMSAKIRLLSNDIWYEIAQVVLPPKEANEISKIFVNTNQNFYKSNIKLLHMLALFRQKVEEFLDYNSTEHIENYNKLLGSVKGKLFKYTEKIEDEVLKEMYKTFLSNLILCVIEEEEIDKFIGEIDKHHFDDLEINPKYFIGKIIKTREEVNKSDKEIGEFLSAYNILTQTIAPKIHENFSNLLDNIVKILNGYMCLRDKQHKKIVAENIKTLLAHVQVVQTLYKNESALSKSTLICFLKEYLPINPSQELFIERSNLAEECKLALNHLPSKDEILKEIRKYLILIKKDSNRKNLFIENSNEELEIYKNSILEDNKNLLFRTSFEDLNKEKLELYKNSILEEVENLVYIATFKVLNEIELEIYKKSILDQIEIIRSIIIVRAPENEEWDAYKQSILEEVENTRKIATASLAEKVEWDAYKQSILEQVENLRNSMLVQVENLGFAIMLREPNLDDSLEILKSYFQHLYSNYVMYLDFCAKYPDIESKILERFKNKETGFHPENFLESCDLLFTKTRKALNPEERKLLEVEKKQYYLAILFKYKIAQIEYELVHIPYGIGHLKKILSLCDEADIALMMWNKLFPELDLKPNFLAIERHKEYINILLNEYFGLKEYRFNQEFQKAGLEKNAIELYRNKLIYYFHKEITIRLMTFYNKIYGETGKDINKYEHILKIKRENVPVLKKEIEEFLDQSEMFNKKIQFSENSNYLLKQIFIKVNYIKLLIIDLEINIFDIYNSIKNKKSCNKYNNFLQNIFLAPEYISKIENIVTLCEELREDIQELGEQTLSCEDKNYFFEVISELIFQKYYAMVCIAKTVRFLSIDIETHHNIITAQIDKFQSLLKGIKILFNAELVKLNYNFVFCGKTFNYVWPKFDTEKTKEQIINDLEKNVVINGSLPSVSIYDMYNFFSGLHVYNNISRMEDYVAVIKKKIEEYIENYSPIIIPEPSKKTSPEKTKKTRNIVDEQDIIEMIANLPRNKQKRWLLEELKKEQLSEQRKANIYIELIKIDKSEASDKIDLMKNKLSDASKKKEEIIKLFAVKPIQADKIREILSEILSIISPFEKEEENIQKKFGFIAKDLEIVEKIENNLSKEKQYVISNLKNTMNDLETDFKFQLDEYFKLKTTLKKLDEQLEYLLKEEEDKKLETKKVKSKKDNKQISYITDSHSQIKPTIPITKLLTKPNRTQKKIQQVHHPRLNTRMESISILTKEKPFVQELNKLAPIRVETETRPDSIESNITLVKEEVSIKLPEPAIDKTPSDRMLHRTTEILSFNSFIEQIKTKLGKIMENKLFKKPQAIKRLEFKEKIYRQFTEVSIPELKAFSKKMGFILDLLYKSTFDIVVENNKGLPRKIGRDLTKYVPYKFKMRLYNILGKLKQLESLMVYGLDPVRCYKEFISIDKKFDLSKDKNFDLTELIAELEIEISSQNYNYKQARELLNDMKFLNVLMNVIKEKIVIDNPDQKNASELFKHVNNLIIKAIELACKYKVGYLDFEFKNTTLEDKLMMIQRNAIKQQDRQMIFYDESTQKFRPLFLMKQVSIFKKEWGQNEKTPIVNFIIEDNVENIIVYIGNGGKAVPNIYKGIYELETELRRLEQRANGSVVVLKNHMFSFVTNGQSFPISSGEENKLGYVMEQEIVAAFTISDFDKRKMEISYFLSSDEKGKFVDKLEAKIARSKERALTL